MKSDETIAEGLSEAQRIKKESSFANQKILADFASKLPYTRIGKAEYTQVYQFVADPVEAEDCSEGKKQDKGLSETVNVMENQKHERNKDQEVSDLYYRRRPHPDQVLYNCRYPPNLSPDIYPRFIEPAARSNSAY